MSTQTISWTLRVAGAFVDATSCVFSDPTGTFGVKRDDTDAVVVADGTALTHPAVGHYQYTFVEPADGLVYTYWIEWVYGGNTYYVEHTVAGHAATATPSPVPGAVTSGCGGRYAEAWQFASFWCTHSLYIGTDDSGADAKDHLEDSQVDFVEASIEPNVGMVLYNLTDGSSGPVTAVDEHTLHATLAGGTDNRWDDGDSYRIVPITQQQIATINNFLDIAASDLHAALAAADACGCSFASWALTFLRKLNIIDAAAYYRCPCAQPNMTDEARTAYLEWMNNQLELIRTGKLEVCSGATGADFPAIDWAEQSVTEFSAAQIIFNDQTAS